MNIVFAGTGAFGVPALQALVTAGHAPKLVLSQPDRPAGRKRKLTPPPLAAAATEAGLPLEQPERLNTRAVRERLAAEEPDLLIVIAYGQIVRSKVLALPRLGCWNLHGSLLPQHRGASPIQAALLAGDTESGVTLMRMDEGLDTGPILATVRTPIAPEERAGELHDRLAALGAPLLLEGLAAAQAGTLSETPQDDAAASTCGLIHKRDGELRFDEAGGAAALVRRTRAMTPWPGARTQLSVRGKPVTVTVTRADTAELTEPKAPGTIVSAGADGIRIATVEGLFVVRELKPAGKRELAAEDFLRGYPLVQGSVAGAAPEEGTKP